MKAGLRLIMACWAAASMLAPTLAIAQQTAPATTNTPAAQTPPTDTVGPRELQNFNLSGRVTREADQPPATAPAPAARESRTNAPANSASVPSRDAAAPATSADRTASRSASADESRSPVAQPPASAARAPAPLPQSDSAAPTTLGSATTAPAPAPGFAPDPQPSQPAPAHGMGFWPWLLAALVLGAGAAFLIRRNHAREAFAGGPHVEPFVAPQPTPRPMPRPAPGPRAAGRAPAPSPAPAPAPRPATAPSPAPARAPAPSPAMAGLVSTRLRPWVEIGVHPVRCVIDENNVTIDFEVELFNSGSAPARGLLAEASLFNASPAQEQEIAAFFGKPVGAGERIPVLAPLKRVTVRSQVVAPLGQVQAYELGGHQVFVPVIAFNALYSWSSGEGQTSASYLLGRDSNGDKLAPFRLDLGPRIFRGLAARVLPTAVRQ